MYSMIIIRKSANNHAAYPCNSMNLGELRLRALQSLKRPYTATIPTDTDITRTTNDIISNTTTTTAITTTPTTDIDNDNSSITTDDGKEEGEITDTSSSSDVESESASSSSSEEEAENYNHHNIRHNTNKQFNSYSAPRYQNRKNTWTRNRDYQDLDFDEDIISLDLDELLDEKVRVLELLDENQSLLAASEDKEQDLLEQLKECRQMKRDCEKERVQLDRKLDRLKRRIETKEFIEGEARKKVSSTNFKKQFVGELLKGSYCRSLPSFPSSDLCKLYCDTLNITERDLKMRFVVDVFEPLCPTELQLGRCQYKDEGMCSMQHLK